MLAARLHSVSRWRGRERLPKSLISEQGPRAWKWPRAGLFNLLLLLVTQMYLRFDHHPLPQDTCTQGNCVAFLLGSHSFELGKQESKAATDSSLIKTEGFAYPKNKDDIYISMV